MKNFNVVTDPLFDVLTEQGVKKASIRDIHTNAQSMFEFAGTPMDQAVAYNTTIAILRDLDVTNENFDWATADVSQYDMNTFMQENNLAETHNEIFPWCPLKKEDIVCEIGYCHPRIPVNDNEANRMKPHPIPYEYEMCQRCCANGLLSNVLFARAGGRGYGSSVGGMFPLYFWKIGENLAEFIEINYGKSEKAAWNIRDLIGHPFEPSLGRPDNPRYLTVNQSQTIVPRFMECYWEKPEMPCVVCGDLSLFHAKKMCVRGVTYSLSRKALTKKMPTEDGEGILHNFVPPKNKEESFPLFVYATDPRMLYYQHKDEPKNVSSWSSNQFILEKGNAQFGDKWKAFGMMVEKVKRAEIFEQYVLSPDCLPERRLNLPDKIDEKSSFVKSVEPPVFEGPSPRVFAGVAAIKRIEYEHLFLFRQACYANVNRTNANVLDLLDKLWRKTFVRTSLKFKRAFFETIWAYSCSQLSGFKRPNPSVVLQLSSSPCMAVMHGNLDWVYVLSVISGE